MVRKTIFLVAFILVISNIEANSYRTNWAKYILADICLGAPIDFYEKFAKEEGDANSLRAVRWFRQGIMIENISQFERVELEKNVVRIVRKDNKQPINGSELILTNEKLYNEQNVRLILVNLSLGAELSEYMTQFNNPDMQEALMRRTYFVAVSNLNLMERIKLNDQWTIVKKGTKTPVDAKTIKLDTDEDFYQENARYMFADMCLGGSVDFYREILYKWRDPNAGGALNMLDNGVKITNLSLFERRTYGDKCDIVYKGTTIRINGNDVKLSTDNK
ncbi:MAG: hypothetical protein U0W24_01470 [Bacteroidales bacterium]